MEPIGSKLRVAHYEASDGPRIMIFGPLDADFDKLRQLFVELGETPDSTYQLEAQPFVAAFGGIQVRLVCTGPILSNAVARQGLRQIASEPGPIFQWTRSSENWDYLAQLVAPIVTSVNPAHQYLTRYPGEDAIVVVSKGEYGDEVVT